MLNGFGSHEKEGCYNFYCIRSDFFFSFYFISAVEASFKDSLSSGKDSSTVNEISFLERLSSFFRITGHATSGPSRFLWKPVSESDGHLAILVSGCSGASLYTLDGRLIEKGSSRGASNGYSDTVRFKKSGGSYPDKIAVHTCGGRCYIKDSSSRITSCARPPAAETPAPVVAPVPVTTPPPVSSPMTGQVIATSAYEEKVFYGSDPKQFYMLRILPEHQNSKKINIGFYNHGGGWVDSTTFTQFSSTASYFETQGYSSVNIEYRNCDNNIKFPVPVEDVALGVNHAVNKIKSMGYEIQDTFWIGHSAGGINGALLLYSNNYPNITEVDKFISLGALYRVESIRPRMLDSIIAVSNFNPSQHLIFNGKTHVPALLVQGYGMTNSKGITGDAYDIYGQVSESANPNSHMNFFANQLRSYGIPAETYALIPGHHGTPIIEIDARNSNYLAVLNAFLKKDFCNIEGACPYPPGSSSTQTKPGIIIPLYSENAVEYNKVIQVKNANKDVPMVVIINPNNGPGAGVDSFYQTYIPALQNAGVKVIGYVYTQYGARSSSVVKADIDKYKQFYPSLEGIFFDEMANVPGSETYYRNLVDYAKTKGFSFSVGNPGAVTSAEYIGIMNFTIIYEDQGLPSISQFQNYASYDNNKLGMLPYDVGTYSADWVKQAADIVGWIYFYNPSPEPWVSLSPYFEQIASTLNSILVNSTTPPTNGTSPPLRECTSYDWSPSQSSLTCPRAGYITFTWTRLYNCSGGVQHPASEQRNCVYNPTWAEKDDDSDGVLNAYDKCIETAAGLKVNPKGCPLPKLGSYKSSFIGASDLNEVRKFELKSDRGLIKFDSPVSLVRWGDALNIGDYVSFEQNKITIDSYNLPELNVPATLVFNNLNLTEPVVLRDGVLCSECTLNYVNGIAIVSVSGFSSYELVEKSFYDAYLNQVTPPPASSCVPSWFCSNWTLCENDNQIRECFDNNSCNTTSAKPSEFQSCTVTSDIVCNPIWECSDWSPEVCPEDEERTRVCSDKNNCYVISGKPDEKEVCIFYEQESNSGIIIIVIILLIILAGGAWLYYTRFVKPKKYKENPVQQNPVKPNFVQQNQFRRPMPLRGYKSNNSRNPRPFGNQGRFINK